MNSKKMICYRKSLASLFQSCARFELKEVDTSHAEWQKTCRGILRVERAIRQYQLGLTKSPALCAEHPGLTARHIWDRTGGESYLL